MQNSIRFINAYNKIDNTLRSVFDYKDNMTFTDIVRRTVPKNSIVRMYEDDLVAFARLRNAIIHKSGAGMVIAEPHDSVTEEIEKIARLIATPPLAFQALVKSKVHICDKSERLADVMKSVKNSDHSNMPVYDDSRMMGVINNKLLVESVGEALNRGESVDEYLRMTEVGSVIRPAMEGVYYTIVPKDATLERVLNEFQNNRKLAAIIMTPRGTNLEQPVGIITPTDILDINEILENY